MKKALTVTFLLIWLAFSCLPYMIGRADDESFVYDSKEKRDPFLSPKIAGIKKSQLGVAQLKVEGIVRDKNQKSYVVVNGEIVRIGESFSGYRVKEIQPNKVVFEKASGEVFDVLLSPEEETLKSYIKESKHSIQEESQKAENISKEKTQVPGKV